MFRPSQAGISVTRHSCLYESAPAYVTNQPPFLNAAVEARTFLPPSSLLKTLKAIESDLGRDLSPSALRYGPRPIDLDIIFYSHARFKVNQEQPSELIVPHPRFAERPFVVAPLVDLLSEGEGRGVGHESKDSFSTPDAEVAEATALTEAAPVAGPAAAEANVSRHWSNHEEMEGGLLG